jgi:hypothetical protein
MYILYISFTFSLKLLVIIEDYQDETVPSLFALMVVVILCCYSLTSMMTIIKEYFIRMFRIKT